MRLGQARGGDFVTERQTESIVLYHKIRNCIIDCHNLMARLGKFHAMISTVQLGSPPAAFNIAVAMLESLMATHYSDLIHHPHHPHPTTPTTPQECAPPAPP